MAEIMQSFLAITLLLHLTLTISQFQSILSKPNGLTMKLIPANSPESPLYHGNITLQEQIQKLIKITKARANYLQYYSNPALTNSTMDIESYLVPVVAESFFYSVEIKLGDPGINLHLLLDSSGSIIWTQCEPCINCFPQKGERYDSRVSTKYLKLHCAHPLCQGIYQCVNGECVYNLVYSAKEATKGVASLDRFTFSNDTYMDDIIFGCSKDNTDMQFDRNGVISGVLGLSNSPQSLMNQLPESFQGSFSYCFPTFGAKAEGKPSLLTFGSDVPDPPEQPLLQTIKFVNPPGSHQYYLNLQDISVGHKKLGLPPGLFRVKEDGSGGCIIDSGSLFTVIDQDIDGFNAYSMVMKAFQDYYDGYRLHRVEDKSTEFELCYEKPRNFRRYATLTFHFDKRGEYVVHSEHANYFNNHGGYFCIPILPGSGGLFILGAWHQQNKQIIYCRNDGLLQFVTKKC